MQQYEVQSYHTPLQEATQHAALALVHKSSLCYSGTALLTREIRLIKNKFYCVKHWISSSKLVFLDMECNPQVYIQLGTSSR